MFEVRFAHLSESLGDIDVYLHDPDGPPAEGTQVATLSRGDVMDFADFAEGAYRATITAAGTIGTVYFQSDVLAFVAQNSHTLSLFDGNENNTGPYILTSMTATGQAAAIIDPSFPPTINFVHAAQTLQAVDVYDDEELTNLLAPDISLGQSSGDLDTTAGVETFYFTPTGSVATTLFSSEVIVVPGTRPYLYLAGPTDEWRGFLATQDRASSLVSAKLTLFNGSVNHPLLDLYALERGVEFDDNSFARAIFVGGGVASPAVPLAAGSYDLYVTSSGTRTILDGPYELDVEIGDVVSLLAVDEVDPEIVLLVNPFVSP